MEYYKYLDLKKKRTRFTNILKCDVITSTSPKPLAVFQISNLAYNHYYNNACNGF